MANSMANVISQFKMIRFSIASYHESRGHGMKYMQAIKPILSQMAKLVSIKSDFKDGLKKQEIDDVIRSLFKASVLLLFFFGFFVCVCVCVCVAFFRMFFD